MRAYHRVQLQLSGADEQQLRAFLRGGVQQVRAVLRALALLQLAGGQSAPVVARNLTLSPKAVRAIARIRRLGLQGTELARAQATTIRRRLLKIGARIRITARKVWLSMASSYPLQRLFGQVHQNLRPAMELGG